MATLSVRGVWALAICLCVCPADRSGVWGSGRRLVVGGSLCVGIGVVADSGMDTFKSFVLVEMARMALLIWTGRVIRPAVTCGGIC